MNNRVVLVGMTMVAACACGAGAGLASVVTAAGRPAPAGWFYAALLLTGALLTLGGIDGWKARIPLAGGFAALLAAGLLAPPAVMRDGLNHSTGNLTGFALYVLAAVLLIAGFLRVCRSGADASVTAALAGVALAAGCTCCLTPGAIRYGLLSTGLVPTAAVSRLALVALGVVAGSIGFLAAGNRRALAFFLGGVLLVYPVEKLVEAAVPVWRIGEASLTFLLRYPVWLTGTGLMLYAAGLLLLGRRRSTAAVR